MNRQLFWLPACLLLCALTLGGGDGDRQPPQQTPHSVSTTVKMHHLHMLINHSLQMAAQGADMNLMGIEHGPAMLDKASDLLNRAMSGPEMADMHKDGFADAPLMKMTHDLASKAVELIGVMKTLSPESGDLRSLLMLNHAVEVAATGNSMIMQGQQGMAGDIDSVMVNHGQIMLGEASGILHGVTEASDYKRLATDVVSMLIGIPEIPSAEQNDKP